MGDDVIQRLFDKIDALSDRLARVETILAEREKSHKEKEESKHGYANIVAWFVTTAVAIYGAIHK